ncbi:MAG: M56 family metallopeptidase [Flavisolibacter sp.]
MTLLASYLVKVIACSGILFLYYHVALRNKVFHQWNRFYLLAATFLSIVIPVVEVQISNSGDDVVFLNAVQAPNIYLDTVVVKNQPAFSPENWIVPGYVFVSVVLLSLLLYSLFRLRQIIRANPVQKVDNIKFINTAEQGTPFSFFKFIFWNREINLDTQEGQHIFQHELVHVREKHSFDKLFMQLVLVVFWANPFFWLMRRELKAIHEFIADKKAVGSYGAEAFAAMILQAGFGKHYHAVANSFFEKSIKRRLLMITKMEKTRISYFSRVAALPVIAFVVMAFGTKLKDSAKEIVADVVTTVKHDEPARDTIPEMYYKGKRIKNTEVKSRKNTVYLFFEDGTIDSLSMQQAAELKILPPPPPPLPKVEIEAAVNVKEWRSFLSKNLAPIISRLSKTTKPGSYTYMVRFIVGLDGSVSYPEALNDPLGIASELEEMMKKSPRWTPGENNHKKVRSFHTQPITIYIAGVGTDGGDESYSIKADSISGITDKPLYIVDRKEYNGNLDEFSAGSIQTISVLKNALAIAKYGERGRNGVVEIRTYNGNGLNEVIVQGKPLSKADTVPDKEAVFEKMEQPPYVNMQQWRQHLSKQLGAVIEKAANKGMTSGLYTVELKFIVEKDGSISHVQALNDPGYGLADAAMKALRTGPKWHPGKQNGMVVRAYHVQPVTFVISDDVITNETTGTIQDDDFYPNLNIPLEPKYATLTRQEGTKVYSHRAGKVVNVSKMGQTYSVMIKSGEWIGVYSGLMDVPVKANAEISRGTLLGEAGKNQEGFSSVDLLVINNNKKSIDPLVWIK